jgi:glycosyltransferase involved in cell wall biosynthesis
MKIAHVASYGPNTCGIYEACRDMMRADITAGHRVFFVDSGYTENNIKKYYPIGTIDDRANFKIVTADPKILDDVDLIVAHNMPQHEWISRNQTPIMFVVHGRPLYSFRLEQNSDSLTSYSYISGLSEWPRVKKMLYFWPEFKPYWSAFPEEKHAILEYPIIDNVRFNPEGEKHVIEDKNKGEFNILICDSWREDIDMFEIVNGAIQYARENKNVKFHIYAIDLPLKPCWDILFKELDKLGVKGELCGRMLNMEKVYRSMDAVLTPHRIVVRVIGEALSCGVPVIASNKCKLGQFHCDPHNPYDIARAIKEFTNSNQELNKLNALEQSKNLSMFNYSREMNKIYNEIIKK